MSLKVLREMVANFSQPLRAEGCGRAGTSFILARSLRQKRKACLTPSYFTQGFEQAGMAGAVWNARGGGRVLRALARWAGRLRSL